MKKILILTANPRDSERLRLGEEVREIQAGLERSPLRDEFEIISRWAVRPKDLRRSLLKVQPQIVHFSGHGAGNDGLVLEDSEGNAQPVSAEALAGLFGLCTGHLECVLLNACYAEVQAEAIYRHIDCVIGMNQAIGDRAAIEFAEGFYEALGAGLSYQDAFEWGCKAIDLEGIPESEIPVLKGFDEKYLQLLERLCAECRTEGFSPDTIIPMLENVFVPLELGASFASSESATQNGPEIWELIHRSRQEEEFRQILIQAQGGFGKTTLLRHIALTYCKGTHTDHDAPRLIPFLLRLRDLQPQLAQPPCPTLPDLITDFYLPKFEPTLTPPSGWAEQLLVKGDALVMLDGFDEVAQEQRRDLSFWISSQMQAYDQTTFILTSRPAGYRDYCAPGPRLPLFVKKFNTEQQEEFLKRWYFRQEHCSRSDSDKNQEQIEADANDLAQKLLRQIQQNPNRSELQQMAENPLLLNMLVTFYRFVPGVELPQKRHQLYQKICDLQLEDRPRARGIRLLLEQRGTNQRVLQSLALKMLKDNSLTISRQNAISFFQEHAVLQEAHLDAENFLNQMVQDCELLVKQEVRNEYEFPHLNFQSFLAAVELYERLQHRQSDVLKLVIKNWENSFWRETILFFTTQLELRTLIDLLNSAIKREVRAAELAYDCLRECQKLKQLSTDLPDELVRLEGAVWLLRSHTLEKYLRNKQWKAADKENYRLMITAIGKIEGQWFTSEDFQNFPDNDLKNIDRLWMEYSKERFGFSIQRKIYLECGGDLDWQFREEEWNTFCERVGWQRDKKYVPVQYDINSPKGHLPGGCWKLAKVANAGFNGFCGPLLSHPALRPENSPVTNKEPPKLSRVFRILCKGVKVLVSKATWE